jgi:hypothetical protein
MERAVRLGVYAGLAAVKLGDNSYARQFFGRAITEVSEVEYVSATAEIHGKLLAAGIIQPDEDPFDQYFQPASLP